MVWAIGFGFRPLHLEISRWFGQLDLVSVDVSGDLQMIFETTLGFRRLH